MAKTKTDKEKVVEKILAQQNKKMPEWKKTLIEESQIAFFRGADKELEEFVVEREMDRLIVSDSKKRMNLT